MIDLHSSHARACFLPQCSQCLLRRGILREQLEHECVGECVLSLLQPKTQGTQKKKHKHTTQSVTDMVCE